MFSKLQLVQKYLRYYITAYNGKGHGVHSPFVFDFIIHVLNDKTRYADYDKVESIRRQLLQDPRVVGVEDMGAGSTKDKGRERRVRDIARHAAKPPKFGQLLYRMVRYYGATNILELGTSLGITSRYLALGNPQGTLTTVEGASEVAELAAGSMKEEGLHNIHPIIGNFDDQLPLFLEKNTPDFVFIDGNHREEPTIDYFKQLAEVSHNDTILVFDDIHWSVGMEQAWKFIQTHPATHCTIDLFFIGIVLFRQEFREQQHFAIRF